MKFTAHQIKSEIGCKLDSFVLRVDGVKFGELHGIDMDGYRFYFNRTEKLVAWMDEQPVNTSWNGFKGGLEMAKLEYFKEAAYQNEMAEAAFEAAR